MKLIRFGKSGQEKPGVVLPDGKRIDTSAFGEDYTEQFFTNDGIARLAAWLKTNQSTCPQVDPNERLGAPLARPSKIVCIGLNYVDHAKETNAAIPAEPIVFFKSTTAMCGPNDQLVIPKNSTNTDWEVELAVVIGKRTSYVDAKDANDHIAGYMLHNDYSERAFQLERNGQWVKGKSADTFAPLGPYLVTRDEMPDPGRLRMWLSVNGTMRQESSTELMIFTVPELVSYVSQFMTLLPGDVISTGTPAGVGLGMKPSP